MRFYYTESLFFLLSRHCVGFSPSNFFFPPPFLDTMSQAMETRLTLTFKGKYQVNEAILVKDYENDYIETLKIE